MSKHLNKEFISFRMDTDRYNQLLKKLGKGQVCLYAAKHGDLEMLKWANEIGLFTVNCVRCRKGSTGRVLWTNNCCNVLSSSVFEFAAERGHIHVLSWLLENGCAVEDGSSYWATMWGELDILKWLHQRNIPFCEGICNIAYDRAHYHILHWLFVNGYKYTPEPNSSLLTEKKHYNSIIWLCNNTPLKLSNDVKNWINHTTQLCDKLQPYIAPDIVMIIKNYL